MEVINKYDCIEDRAFQRWLAEHKLLERRSDRQMKQIFGLALETELLPTESEIYRYLNAGRNKFYIVSQRQVAQRIGKNVSNPNDLGTIRQHIHTLKGKLTDSDYLVTHWELGWSVRVNYLGVTSDTMRLLYLLRESFGEVVDRDELTWKLYGSLNKAEYDCLITRVAELRKVLQPTGLTMPILSRRLRGYKIEEK